MIQFPSDIHRFFAVVLYIVRCAEIRIGGSASGNTIRLEFTYKQQNTAAFLAMVNVSLTGGRILCRCTLALPMEQLTVDGIVVVHRGRRVVLVCLIQGHKEHVDVLLWQPLHTLTNGRRFHEIECYKELIAGICAVQIQWAIKANIYRLVNEVDMVLIVLQQIHQFAKKDWAVSQRVKIVKYLIAIPIVCCF